MIEQLLKTTGNYKLAIGNNGFNELKFLRSLNPAISIENRENVGIIRAINQALEKLTSKYVAFLHSDLLIFNEGWLEQIIDFIERRSDVGLVGFAGRHTIREDGKPNAESTIVNMRGYPEYCKPTWKITEVATIYGLSWVTRGGNKA